MTAIATPKSKLNFVRVVRRSLLTLGSEGCLGARAHLIYLLLAIPSFFFLLFAYPNFHAGDDTDHFKRAYTLIEAPFEIVSPQGRSSGAMIDVNLTRYVNVQYDIVMRPDWQRFDFSRGDNPLKDLPWTDRKEFASMAGAVSYLPFLYTPQSVAIIVGRATGLTIAETVFLARVLNGLSAILLTWLGLFLLPQGHALILAVLFLPRTMLQYPSNAADPLLFALALIIIALALRPALHRRLLTVVMSAALLVVAAVRPPLGALAMVPAGIGLLQRRAQAIIYPAIATVLAAAWVIWARVQIYDPRCPGEQGSMGEMVRDFTISLPSLLPATFAEDGAYYFLSLVANYGYGNGPAGYIGAPFPWLVYFLAFLLMAWGMRLDAVGSNLLPRWSKPLLLVAAVAMTLLTFLAMYVACTPVQSSTVTGVQGRYFVTVLFTLAPVMAGIMGQRHAWPWRPYAIALTCWVAGCTTLMVTAAPGLYRL